MVVQAGSDAWSMTKALEDYWERKYPNEKRMIITGKLGRFSERELVAIYERTVETFKPYPQKPLPDVADLFETAKDLGFTTAKPKKPRAKLDCERCHGRGWREEESIDAFTGEKYDSLRRCECTGVRHPEGNPLQHGRHFWRHGEPS